MIVTYQYLVSVRRVRAEVGEFSSKFVRAELLVVCGFT
jgi:hypothetical protein